MPAVVKEDISTAFKSNEGDRKIASTFLLYHTPKEQIAYFKEKSSAMSDSFYWFCLSTLWVDDPNGADIATWKQMFSVRRSNKEISLMKPSELKALKSLPNKITVYRAQKSDELDWISYTTSLKVLLQFARINRSTRIIRGTVKKRDITALFTRRDESEVLILDKKVIRNIENINVTDISRVSQ
jgi:hypothetical protein